MGSLKWKWVDVPNHLSSHSQVSMMKCNEFIFANWSWPSPCWLTTLTCLCANTTRFVGHVTGANVMHWRRKPIKEIRVDSSIIFFPFDKTVPRAETLTTEEKISSWKYKISHFSKFEKRVSVSLLNIRLHISASNAALPVSRTAVRSPSFACVRWKKELTAHLSAEDQRPFISDNFLRLSDATRTMNRKTISFEF